MAARIKHGKNKFTGQAYAEQKNGFYFEFDEEQISLWKKWWRLVKREQLITFLLMGLAGMIMLMLVSHSLLFGRDLPFGMEFLRAEGIALSEQVKLIKPFVFYAIVSIIFFTTAFGVLDHVARLSSDIIHTYCSKSRFQSTLLREDNLYLIILWFMISFGILVLLVLNIDKPPQLLSIAGSLSGMLMFVYSLLILVLNLYLGYMIKRNVSKNFNPFKLTYWRIFMIVCGILLYGWFSVSLITS